MTREELTILINGLNEHMRTYVAFDYSEGNDAIAKGWFNENDITNFGIMIEEDDEPKVIYDEYFDKEVIDLCKCLNNMEGLTTTESCCGHLKEKYMIFFTCNNFSTLAKIFRSVNRNYSDGKWELLVDGSDVQPVCQFWLRSKEPFNTYEEMNESVNRLIENIKYWTKPEYDEYFNPEKYL